MIASGASLSVSRPTNAAGMPTGGEDIVTQEQFFAFIEQEIRKIDLFTKRMVSRHHHHTHFIHIHPSHSLSPIHTLSQRVNQICRMMHPLTNYLPHIRVVLIIDISIIYMSFIGTRYT